MKFIKNFASKKEIVERTLMDSVALVESTDVIYCAEAPVIVKETTNGVKSIKGPLPNQIFYITANGAPIEIRKSTVEEKTDEEVYNGYCSQQMN